MRRWTGASARRTARLVVAEYGTRCHLCGQSIDLTVSHPDPKSLSIDHLVPQSRGGSHALENLRPAHLGCNASRGARHTPYMPIDGRGFFSHE